MAKEDAKEDEDIVFTIRLPHPLVRDLDEIASTETRSRNQQIEKFLADATYKWFQKAEGK